jgi:hypothetical protein
MQNKKFCMASAWLRSNLLVFSENCETVSAILFQPRLPNALIKLRLLRQQSYADAGAIDDRARSQ